MDKIVLFSDASWEWLDLVSQEVLSKKRHITLTLGHDWSDRQVNQMVTDYYADNLDWLFQ